MEENGEYTTRAAYAQLIRRKIRNNSEEKEEFKLIWNRIALPKVRIHAWRVLWERVPTTTKLQSRRCLPQGTDVNCPFCGTTPEVVRQVFF